jgi:hypothetical protein
MAAASLLSSIVDDVIAQTSLRREVMAALQRRPTIMSTSTSTGAVWTCPACTYLNGMHVKTFSSGYQEVLYFFVFCLLIGAGGSASSQCEICGTRKPVSTTSNVNAPRTAVAALQAVVRLDW